MIEPESLSDDEFLEILKSGDVTFGADSTNTLYHNHYRLAKYALYLRQLVREMNYHIIMLENYHRGNDGIQS